MGLWSPETRSFDGVRLRRAIVARGWTVSEFARAARLNVQSVYNALSGKPVRDGTAIRIFETLEKRAPMMSALDVA
jgi:predicted transcriptional regulator